MTPIKTILTLTLLATLSAFGQDTHDIDVKPWTIGIHFMPSIVDNLGTSGEADYLIVSGLKIEKEISDHLTIGTGLTYYKTDMYHGRWHGGFCPTPIMSCDLYSKTTYLEIPTTATFYYSKDRKGINPYLTLGVLTAFSIKSTHTSVDENGTEIAEYNNFKYQQNYLSVAFGTEFRMARNMSFIVEPAFKYSLNYLIRRSDHNHTIMVGLKTGLTIQL